MNQANKHWTASEKDRRNQRQIVFWSLAWIVPFLFVDLAVSNDWIESDAFAIVGTLAVTILGVGLLLAFRRFLKDADELRRKIELDALALTVGVGVVAGFSYSLLESAGLIDKAELMNLVVVMAATYVISVNVGLRRFA
jgi:fluoride ion exporter CrcB/FEX